MATGIFQGITAGADAIAEGIRRRRELVLAQQEKQEARAYEQSLVDTERQRQSEKEKYEHEEKLAGMKAAGKDVGKYEGLSPQAFTAAIETERSQAEENENNQKEMIDLINLKLEEYPPEQTVYLQQMIAQSIKGFPIETVEQITTRRETARQQELDLARARNPVRPIVQGGAGGSQGGRGGSTKQVDSNAILKVGDKTGTASSLAKYFIQMWNSEDSDESEIAIDGVAAILRKSKVNPTQQIVSDILNERVSIEQVLSGGGSPSPPGGQGGGQETREEAFRILKAEYPSASDEDIDAALKGVGY